MKNENIQQLMYDIADWSDGQFGEGRNPTAIIHHLKKEVPELIEALEKFQKMGLRDGNKRDEAMKDCLYEFADCFMLLLDSARSFGLDSKTLIEFTHLKLEINKNRKWGKPDENGVVEHIKK